MIVWPLRQRDRQPQPLVENELLLRRPKRSDYPAWKALREESREFLQPWEPTWPEGDLSAGGFRRRVDSYRIEAADGTGFTYFLFRAPRGELLGGLGLTAIRLGASRSAQLGYWMGRQHAGNGLMRRAVKLAIAASFKAMRLERVEAACVPQNQRSIRLLEGIGFEREGYAKSYLEINGERRDHILYAMTRSRWRARGEA